MQCSSPPPSLQQSDRTAGCHDRGSTQQQPQTIVGTPCPPLVMTMDRSLVLLLANLAPNQIQPEHRSFSRSLRLLLQQLRLSSVDAICS